MAERVALREVAAAARVSVSTASLALAGSSRVAAATAERVQHEARRLGYVRDPILAGLAARRFRRHGKPLAIGLSVDAAHWVPRLAANAAPMGLAVRALGRDEAADPARLRALGLAALVVGRRGTDPAACAALPLPTVLWMDEGPPETPVDLVETCEWWTATVGAAARMRAAGFPRFLVVLHPASPRHWHDDVRLAAARSLGQPVVEWDYDDASLAAHLRRHRPAAVLGFMPVVDLALQRLGRCLPFAALLQIDDKHFAGYDGWLADYRQRDQVTLELIEQRLRFGPRPPRRVVIPPRWLAGGSLLRPRAGR